MEKEVYGYGSGTTWKTRGNFFFFFVVTRFSSQAQSIFVLAYTDHRDLCVSYI